MNETFMQHNKFYVSPSTVDFLMANKVKRSAVFNMKVKVYEKRKIMLFYQNNVHDHFLTSFLSPYLTRHSLK